MPTLIEIVSRFLEKLSSRLRLKQRAECIGNVFGKVDVGYDFALGDELDRARVVSRNRQKKVIYGNGLVITHVYGLQDENGEFRVLVQPGLGR